MRVPKTISPQRGVLNWLMCVFTVHNLWQHLLLVDLAEQRRQPNLIGGGRILSCLKTSSRHLKHTADHARES